MAGLTATGKPPCCGVGSLCPAFVRREFRNLCKNSRWTERSQGDLLVTAKAPVTGVLQNNPLSPDSLYGLSARSGKPPLPARN